METVDVVATGQDLYRVPPSCHRASSAIMQTRRVIIERAVCHVFSVDLGEITANTRGKKKVAFARQIAMYLAHVTCGLKLTETGELFERDRTTVAHACSVVEDRRDEPSFDLTLYFLEQSVRNLLGGCYPSIRRQGRSGI